MGASWNSHRWRPPPCGMTWPGRRARVSGEGPARPPLPPPAVAHAAQTRGRGGGGRDLNRAQRVGAARRGTARHESSTGPHPAPLRRPLCTENPRLTDGAENDSRSRAHTSTTVRRAVRRLGSCESSVAASQVQDKIPSKLVIDGRNPTLNLDSGASALLKGRLNRITYPSPSIMASTDEVRARVAAPAGGTNRA